ncbi:MULTISPECIES: hypothetical protein [unclassified Psychrobacter]|uniref:hypothetical protein n=1 Tax=unclassified Psychrobacter TaxID=196806 RepID=UPI003FD6941B
MVLKPIQKTLASLTEKEWITSLQHHYLSTEGPYGDSEIINLDVTPAGLADAIGMNGYSDEEIQNAFMSIFTRKSVRSFLGEKVNKVQGVRAYHHFHFLILSCLIAATTTNAGDSNQYRERLGALLADNQGAEQGVSGINSLWLALTKWIDSQIQQGKSYRRIILPKDIGNMTVIGYAVKLAYPSRDDRKRLKDVLKKLSYRAFESPVSLLIELNEDYYWELPALIQKDLSALKILYESDQSIGSHYFWQLILSVLSEISREDSKSHTLLWSVSVRFGGWDGDELEEVVLAKGNRRQDLEETFWQGSFVEFLKLYRIPKQVKTLLDNGCIVLLERHGGLWTQDDRQPDSEDTAIILTNRTEIIEQFQHPSHITREWCFSESMPLQAVLELTYNQGVAGKNTSEKGLSFEGGIPLGRGKWLARLGYLPLVKIKPNSEFSTNPTLKVQIEDNIVTIIDDDLINKEWHLTQTSGYDEVTSKRIQFFDSAPLNDLWSQRKDGFEASVEFDYQSGTPIIETQHMVSTGVFPNRLCDALEALYARAQAPRSESEVIAILQTALPKRSELKYMVWDVLRSLEEAGWLEQDLNRRWRGRVWRVQAPKIVLTGGLTAIVEGAIANRELEILKVEAIRQNVEIHINAQLEWAAPIISLYGDNIEKLAKELNWSIEIGRNIVAKPAPKCWPVENRSVMGRQLSSIWKAEPGLFVPLEQSISTDKRLVRFVRDDDRDVYAIDEKQIFITTQRNTAILEYARRIKKSVFIYNDGLLKRQSLNGHLPLPIAKWLRRLTGLQSGPAIISKYSQYQYAVSEEQLSQLRIIFGAAIQSNHKFEPKNLILTIAKQRHRGSRISYT